MKIKIYKSALGYMLIFILLTACAKNETFFYNDTQAPGLGIFSNTGNNVFSCYLNGTAWRTEARTSGGILSPPHFEVYIHKQYFDSLRDALTIDWYGGYFGDPYSSLNQISLIVYVPKNYSALGFLAWQGKRLAIDSSTGYFLAQTSPNNIVGYGTIYFNIAKFDTTVENGVAGRMSGLLEADFGSVKLTSGRFDHNLEPIQFLLH